MSYDISQSLNDRIESLIFQGIDKDYASFKVHSTLNLFYSIPDNADHKKAYNDIIELSLQNPFSGNKEFGDFYDNIFGFTLRSASSSDMSRYVFPSMDGYVNLQNSLSFPERLDLHSDLAKIFKGNALIADMDKISRSLSNYGSIENVRRY